ncbi:hypothetical protein J1614_003525 [Plenodomus biglobosus]|nr:hypothetical protein J1614_003525 [Plenodomus biglobosus]
MFLEQANHQWLQPRRQSTAVQELTLKMVESDASHSISYIDAFAGSVVQELVKICLLLWRVTKLKNTIVESALSPAAYLIAKKKVLSLTAY